MMKDFQSLSLGSERQGHSQKNKIPWEATELTTSKFTEPEMIGFLMIPQFSMIAFSAAIEPLRLANYLSGQELYRWVLISRDGGLEKASNGIDIRIDYALADAPALPTVVVCSGVDGHWYDDRQVMAWLRRIAAKGVTIGSVCTASHINRSSSRPWRRLRTWQQAPKRPRYSSTAKSSGCTR